MGGGDSPARRLRLRWGRGKWQPSRRGRQSGSAAGRARPGRAVRAELSFVSSAFGFCFASASFGRAGAGAPPPESLLAVSPLSSEGEASAADWTASRTAGPLLTPLGLRVRRVLRTGGRRAVYSQKCRRP